MINLAVFSYPAFFHFNEVANFGFLTQYRAGTNSGERTDVAIFSYYRVFDHGVGGNDCSLAYAAILEHTIWSDAHIAGNGYIAFQDYIDIYLDVPGYNDFSSHVESGRIVQGNTTQHQSAGFPLLEMPFQFGKLQPVVDTSCFHLITAR